MKKILGILRKIIREEIGRNYKTIDNSPHTFDNFQDYDIEINSDGRNNFFLNVRYKGEKIFPGSTFADHEEAHHAARMIIDNDRVRRMNSWEEREEYLIL